MTADDRQNLVPAGWMDGSAASSASLVHMWRARRTAHHVAAAAGTVLGPLTLVATGRVGDAVDVKPDQPTLPTLDLLIGASLIERAGRTRDGDMVATVTPIFFRVLEALVRDPGVYARLTPLQFEVIG